MWFIFRTTSIKILKYYLSIFCVALTFTSYLSLLLRTGKSNRGTEVATPEPTHMNKTS